MPPRFFAGGSPRMSRLSPLRGIIGLGQQFESGLRRCAGAECAAAGVVRDGFIMEGGLERRDRQRHRQRGRNCCDEGFGHRHGCADGAQVAMNILIVIGIRRGGLWLPGQGRDTGERDPGMGVAE